MAIHLNSLAISTGTVSWKSSGGKERTAKIQQPNPILFKFSRAGAKIFIASSNFNVLTGLLSSNTWHESLIAETDLA